ncbi:putative disease resistance protein RGA1 isoform X2 [Cucumis melo var. makuwa]|uniref:Disease resistance protein RGA1 isoform X2 n=1 Tax=Cucumis melo var. makuwa TaxID=1194695 RepID=A0A5A7UUA5_CUCMM|nr:putative disease resistance protein RGA1 isoform X2 [Cucumis melo var. makuwa]
MADSILFNVAASVITKLGSSALRELGSLWGVNDELDKLQNTLSAIKAVLLDAEEQQSKSHTVKDWISKIKDVFYDIDDLIDEFSYETLRRQVLTKDRTITKQVRIFFSKSNQIAFGFEMGQTIKKVREKLDAIAADKAQLHLSVSVREVRDNEPRKVRETSSFILEGEVIGRDEDRKSIMDFLFNTNNIIKDNVEVVSIVGMGGLGKTALAQAVYNDRKINNHFKLKMWVCISEEFDIKVIVEKILESITKTKQESLQLDILQSMLQEKIDGKKYLLVMDDVWNGDHEKWIGLKRFLMGGARGSKILVTTRNLQVAQASDTVWFHHLKELDKDNSWALFRKMAFLNKEEELENSNLVRMGKEIVGKLKGYPLAIRVVGRLLYFKNTEMDWSSFKDNELDSILQQDDQIQPILKISFNHLPPNLKQCFTYCALFPKDYEFKKEGLVKQWMAQGFIQAHNKKAIEDVGEDYFKELVGRSFFQDVRKNKWGDFKYCKMHDLLHDLACSMGENECAVVSDNDVGSIDKRTRHASFLLSKRTTREVVSKSFTEVTSLRTLDIDSSASFRSFKKTYHMNLFRLRTLNLDRCCCHPPKFIDKLKHLRYLNLSGLNFDSHAKRLRWDDQPSDNDIELSHCGNLEHLPQFDQFPYLKHLLLGYLPNIEYIDSSNSVSSTTFFPSLEKLRIESMPKLKGWWKGEISCPTTLHQLSELCIFYCPLLASIPQHPSLESLRICGVSVQLFEMVIRMATNLSEHSSSSSSSTLSKLSFLEIGTIDLELLPVELFCNMTHLESLIIERCKSLQISSPHLVDEDNGDVVWKKLLNLRTLRLESIPKLEYLPKSLKYITSLETLKLSNCENLVSIEGIGKLTSLSHLEIDRCPNLPLLSEDVGDLISLSHLLIWSCPKLTSLPEGITRLTSLSSLCLEDCPNLVSLPQEFLHHHSSLPGGRFLRILNCPKLRIQDEKQKEEEKEDKEDWTDFTHALTGCR